MGFIDARVHVWTDDTAHYPLARGWKAEDMKPKHFTPEDLFKDTKPAGVARINLIQMRKLLGMGKPRTLQGGGGSSVWVAWCLYWLSARLGSRVGRLLAAVTRPRPISGLVGRGRVSQIRRGRE